MEESRPPGVFNLMINSLAPSFWACSRDLRTYSAVTGWIGSLIVMDKILASREMEKDNRIERTRIVFKIFFTA
jgi:hypothetical protein